jgi:hypothetical protein
MFNQNVDCLESSALKKIERRLTPFYWSGIDDLRSCRSQAREESRQALMGQYVECCERSITLTHFEREDMGTRSYIEEIKTATRQPANTVP